MKQPSKHLEIASYVGRLLRETFGKGPESVFVTIQDRFITIYLRNFISPMEEIILSQKQPLTVQETRELLMKKITPQVIAYIKVLTGTEIHEFYYDWSLENKTGAFMGISKEPFAEFERLQSEFEGKSQFENEISIISEEAQKRPANMFSGMLNPKTLVVIREGILVAIEKELILLGYHKTLKVAKRQLEKRYLHNNSHFESILRAQIVDIFVDWDFDLDKSMMVFILNK